MSQLYYAVFSTPAGWMGVSASPIGLLQVVLPQSSKQAVINPLGIDSNTAQSSDRFHDLIERFQMYFSGKEVEFLDTLDLSMATPFQRKVWRTAQKIPYGKTQSYGWLAGQMGMPQAARAVGQALGRNPLPIIVPCHRVLASGGGLGGFTGGLDKKKYLLGLEKH